MKKLILIMAFAVAMIACTISNEGTTGSGGVIITKAALEEAFATVPVKTLGGTTMDISFPTTPATEANYNNINGFGTRDSIGTYERRLEDAIENMIVPHTVRNISENFVSFDTIYIERTGGGSLNSEFTSSQNLDITVKFFLEDGATTIDGKDTMNLVYTITVT